MSVVFKRVSDSIGFNSDSQGENAFISALLTYANANNSGSDVSQNPFTEVVRRFEAAGINPHALARIKERLFDAENKFNAGVR